MRLSRIINLESAGKERTRLLRCILLSIRELGNQNEVSETTRDLVAYMSVSLLQVNDLVDLSVTAWEKRGYWLKADRFRMDWIWTSDIGKKLGQALTSEDWAQIAGLIGKTAEKLKDVKIPQRHQLGKPWDGAWKTGTWKSAVVGLPTR
jgi:hypothetical protein